MQLQDITGISAKFGANSGLWNGDWGQGLSYSRLVIKYLPLVTCSILLRLWHCLVTSELV